MVNVDLLTTSHAARLANVAANTIRWWADTGRLAVVRTASGVRLFRRDDVERLKALRDERRRVA